MQFEISREALIKPLQLVIGAIERRQTLPILSNVLMVLEQGMLSLTGTDFEVELVGRVATSAPTEDGEITLPARKLMDICKSLPVDAILKFLFADNKAVIRAGPSRFSLATLPAQDFPKADESPGTLELSISQRMLKVMLDSTGFAMAQQDVRYYLNGLLFEITADYLRVVATDGHRLAMRSESVQVQTDVKTHAIVPRKGVLELSRLLADNDDEVRLDIGTNHIRAHTPNFTFTSKLIDGKFPDYDRVLPKGGDKILTAARNELKQSLSRTSILSNEKFHGIRLTLLNDELKIVASNPEQEEAEELMTVEYAGSTLEIGFNVTYLLDVLSVIHTESVQLVLSDMNSSILVKATEDNPSLYVVMPMRL